MSSMSSAALPASALDPALEDGQLVRVTVEVQKQALVDQLHAYLADPSPTSRRGRTVLQDFSSPKRLGLPVQLLEAMVLEGDLSRADVEEFVTDMLDSFEHVVVR